MILLAALLQRAGHPYRRVSDPAASSNTEAGFTLMEVLVAFAIIVLALSVVYQRLGMGMRTMSNAEADRAAADDAGRIMTELGHVRPLAYGISEGDLMDGLHWRLLISPTRVRPPGVALPRLEGHDVGLILSWQQRGRIRYAVFDTVRLGIEQ